MPAYLKNLKSYFLIILASVGIGVIVAHPIAPQLMSECIYDQINSTYTPEQSINNQWNDCLLRPQMISVAATVLAAFLLAAWFRHRLLNETPFRHIVVISLIYGVLQFSSLIFLQSHYLYDAQQAFTFGEIALNYWFAADAIVFYLMAAIATNVALNKRR
jgi:hypothetical protein